jgi:hypothetical protein
MHILDSEAVAMASILGWCSISIFPQTYLGLPLSPHKLRVADYKPLMDNFDKYLTGWKAKLLSSANCLMKLLNCSFELVTPSFMSTFSYKNITLPNAHTKMNLSCH